MARDDLRQSERGVSPASLTAPFHSPVPRIGFQACQFSGRNCPARWSGSYWLYACRNSEDALREAIYGDGLELERATVARTIFERLVKEGRARLFDHDEVTERDSLRMVGRVRSLMVEGANREHAFIEVTAAVTAEPSELKAEFAASPSDSYPTLQSVSEPDTSAQSSAKLVV